MGENRAGKVFLVGAGPGDPKLITVRGMEAIARADVVVYDRLASPRLLRHMKPGAEKVFVGKLPDKHMLKQEEINQLLVDLASSGRVVTRLKGGDPSVFGRVGEEAEKLAENGIEFEIVPGVTSSIAVPAYAGIPVTHRDFTSSFSIVTGHEYPNKTYGRVDWDHLAKASGTLVFLMGVANIGNISEALIRGGKNPETPVALIRWGTWMEQRTLVGTLENIPAKVAESGFSSPAVIIVGDVVKLRERIAWFEKRPLFGMRVLVTRAREQASELAGRIDDLGGDAFEWPVIRTVPLPVDAAVGPLASPEAYDWLVFTSANGVRFFFDACVAAGVDVRRFARARIGAVGPKTAEALKGRGLLAEALPSAYTGDELGKTLASLTKPGERVLLARARVAGAGLPEALRAAGAIVDDLAVYETLLSDEGTEEALELLKEGKLGAVTFTSSSTVTNTLELLRKNGWEHPEEALAGVPAFCIGPVTADAARRSGIAVAAEAEEATIDGLIGALVAHNIKNGGNA
ncbi:uroporphyrinogen-III C-methyltransferase [Paenibacillus antri]|uniref:Uroporphyrinogen-III C-methyltransferase n=1 Tax=Paenibacillus antri TaxID=2582848 RepID=A0A5R9GAM3_9BACL|nr:uroporphyrinogen-III C-methyltransferase [Paenibacillus antri]TLS53512.1 uroporphyrinogen-III C-methyltransferase [Paenibacillus antri]